MTNKWWEKFFDGYIIVLRYYECERTIELEDLYQAFKDRMKAEDSQDQ